MAKRNAKRDAMRRKAVGRAPTWLRTAAIAKPAGKPRVKGTFGAASAGVSIDPATGLPREDG